jgi:hypothetical protein
MNGLYKAILLMASIVVIGYSIAELTGISYMYLVGLGPTAGMVSKEIAKKLKWI